MLFISINFVYLLTSIGNYYQEIFPIAIIAFCFLGGSPVYSDEWIGFEQKVPG